MHDDTIRMCIADLMKEVDIFPHIYRRSGWDFFCFIVVFVNFIHRNTAVTIGCAVHDNMHGNNFDIIFF